MNASGGGVSKLKIIEIMARIRVKSDRNFIAAGRGLHNEDEEILNEARYLLCKLTEKQRAMFRPIFISLCGMCLKTDSQYVRFVTQQTGRKCDLYHKKHCVWDK